MCGNRSPVLIVALFVDLPPVFPRTTRRGTNSLFQRNQSPETLLYIKKQGGEATGRFRLASGAFRPHNKACLDQWGRPVSTGSLKLKLRAEESWLAS
jgi:hypothetical protein